MEYKIISRSNHLAVHSTGYYGEDGRLKAQARCNNGYCAKYWMNKEEASKGFIVVEVKS